MSVTPTRLIDTSCQINEITNSTSVDAKTATCLLQMTVEEPALIEGQEPTTKVINMELPPAALKTLVGDLSRIREQLSNVARK